MSELAVRKSKQSNVVFKHHAPTPIDEKQALKDGLSKTQKTINPKYFYDTYGSELFEKITQVPEYYPTRTERSILINSAEEIAEYCGHGSVLIEPGSGSSEKVRLILDALKPHTYVPMDIAGEFLHRSAITLGEEFPWLKIQAISADFANMNASAFNLPSGKKVVFYPGSTIGNMTPEDAADFLKDMRAWVKSSHADIPDGGILIGVDLHKCTKRLNAAYNDQQGYTEEFNLNVLNHINQRYGGGFKLKNFKHLAFYNEKHMRIEMHLVSQVDHIVRLDDTAIAFSKGETIHTENSYKYTQESFYELAESVGLKVEQSWYDEDQLFGVHYLAVA